MSVAAGIAGSVAATRVFLGVHWFSDVVAGVVVGWAWFGLCCISSVGGSWASGPRWRWLRESPRSKTARARRRIELRMTAYLPTSPVTCAQRRSAMWARARI